MLRLKPDTWKILSELCNGNYLWPQTVDLSKWKSHLVSFDFSFVFCRKAHPYSLSVKCFLWVLNRMARWERTVCNKDTAVTIFHSYFFRWEILQSMVSLEYRSESGSWFSSPRKQVLVFLIHVCPHLRPNEDINLELKIDTKDWFG